jgi:hypothetical protein
LPAQIVVVPASDTVGFGTTVIVASVEFTSEHIEPASRNTAWYKVVVPGVLFAVMVALVLAMVVQLVPLLVEYSQRWILPV